MSIPKQPPPDALRFAAEWLRAYETDGSPEGDMVVADANYVADWLEAMASEKFIRDAARNAGVPVKLLRQRMIKGALNVKT